MCQAYLRAALSAIDYFVMSHFVRWCVINIGVGMLPLVVRAIVGAPFSHDTSFIGLFKDSTDLLTLILAIAVTTLADVVVDHRLRASSEIWFQILFYFLGLIVVIVAIWFGVQEFSLRSDHATLTAQGIIPTPAAMQGLRGASFRAMTAIAQYLCFALVGVVCCLAELKLVLLARNDNVR